MKYSRRFFIAGSLAAIPAAALGYLSFSDSYQEVIVRTLKRSLSNLQLDEKGLRSFAEDFESRYRKGTLKVALIGLSLRIADSPLGMMVRTRLRDFEQITTEMYLLSSNYFLSSRVEGQPIAYIRFYDPYEGFCMNPIAKFT